MPSPWAKLQRMAGGRPIGFTKAGAIYARRFNAPDSGDRLGANRDWVRVRRRLKVAPRVDTTAPKPANLAPEYSYKDHGVTSPSSSTPSRSSQMFATSRWHAHNTWHRQEQHPVESAKCCEHRKNPRCPVLTVSWAGQTGIRNDEILRLRSTATTWSSSSSAPSRSAPNSLSLPQRSDQSLRALLGWQARSRLRLLFREFCFVSPACAD